MELIEPPEMKTSLIPAPVSDKRVRIAGANEARIARSNPAEHAFAVTEVDEAFATEWFKRNKGLKFVKDGAVFMVANEAAYKSEAKDRVAEIKSGLEPIDPTNTNDARFQRGIEVDKKHLAALGVRA
jgi:hypothetical protein